MMAIKVKPDDELYHHGVLGMKWGVRRYQPYPKGKHGKFLNQDRDEDIVIKKGTSAYRVQNAQHLGKDGQAYVSFDKLDHAKYLTAMGSGGDAGVAMDLQLDNGNNGRAYSVRMKLDRDIIAPSYEKTMEAFVRTMDSVGVKDFAKQNMYVKEGKNFVKNFKNMDDNVRLDEAYVTFCGTLMRDTKARQIFYKTLQDQGYNAVIDDWDSRFGTGYTKTPMIVFEKSNLKETKSVPLSEKDADYFSELFWGGAATSKHKDTQDKWDKWAGGTSYRDEHYT